VLNFYLQWQERSGKLRFETNFINYYWMDSEIAKRPYKQGPYKKAEITLLKSNYPEVSAVVLAGRLKRSLASVQKQLREMGLRKRKSQVWTTEQTRTLRRMYKTAVLWEIANRIDKTTFEVRRKAKQLKLKK
jgi:tRNA nucleotidyltransferase (CCA-adding enzyme)